jgi:hypothetical protein
LGRWPQQAGRVGRWYIEGRERLRRQSRVLDLLALVVLWAIVFLKGGSALVYALAAVYTVRWSIWEYRRSRGLDPPAEPTRFESKNPDDDR